MNRFDLTKQNSISESGLKCLSMICRYYGRHVDLTAAFCQTMSVEESLLGISNNAEKIGFSSVIGYLPLTKLIKVTLPCLLYWNNEYYVILRKVMRNTYYIVDPVKGLTKYSGTEIKRYWIGSQINGEEKGIAVFIKPTDEFYKQTKEQDQPIKENSIWRYIKHLLLWKFRPY